MMGMNLEYFPRLDLTLGDNIHNAVKKLGEGKDYVVYNLTLSSSDKEILSKVVFKNNEFRSFQYNSTMPAEKFGYNLENYLDYKLVNNSYSKPLVGILENIYTASSYDNNPGEIITFEVIISSSNDRRETSNHSWHNEGDGFDYLNLITLIGPTTPFCNDEISQKEIIYAVENDPSKGIGIRDCSNFTRPASIEQGIVMNGDAMHSLPFGYIGDRLFLSIVKKEATSEPNPLVGTGWFWEIEV